MMEVRFEFIIFAWIPSLLLSALFVAVCGFVIGQDFIRQAVYNRFTRRGERS
jgi:hypothetical protein